MQLRRHNAAWLILPFVLAACGSTVAGQGSGSANGSDLGTGSAQNPFESQTSRTQDTATAASVATGGSAGNGGSAPGTTASSSTVATGVTAATSSDGSKAAVPSGARVMSPIEIGVMDVANPAGSADALGIKATNTYTGQQLAEAFVAAQNQAGGLAGRKIKMVEYSASNTGDWPTEEQAACATFTQDHHVDVAVSITGILVAENYAQCLTKAHVPDLYDAIAGFDDVALRNNPRLLSFGAPSQDAAMRAEFVGLTKNGTFTPTNLIGVIVEDCAFNVRAYDNTIVPLARQLHLRLLRQDVNCLTTTSDLSTFEQQVAGIVLKFQTAGVDRVTYDSAWASIMMLVIDKQASSQNYYPTYGVNTTGGSGTTASNYSASTLQRTHGVGWEPDADITASTAASHSTVRCRKLFQSAGMTPQTKTDEQNFDTTCTPFFALEAALKKSNGYSRPSGLIFQALEAVGTSLASPLTLAGGTAFDSARHYEPSLVANFDWTSNCSCFHYTTSPRPI